MNLEQQRALMQHMAQYQNMLASQNQPQFPIQNLNPHFFQPQYPQSPGYYVPRQHTPPSTPVSHDFEFLVDTQSIPETQGPSNPNPKPKQRPRTKKGKEAVSKEPVKELHKWTDEESVALCMCWVEVSENPIIGNEQTGEALWVRVGEKYFKSIGKGFYLTLDQQSSKYSHVNCKVKKFNGLFDQCTRTRRSGAGDNEVMLDAVTQFNVFEGGKPPILEWQTLLKSPKWQTLYNSESHISRKRSSQDLSNSPGLSDTSGSFYDLNDDALMDLEEMLRPMGKKQDKAKAKDAPSSSVDEQSSIGRDLVDELGRFDLVEKERADLEILGMDLKTLDPKVRKYYERKQKEIMEALGLSDNDDE